MNGAFDYKTVHRRDVLRLVSLFEPEGQCDRQGREISDDSYIEKMSQGPEAARPNEESVAAVVELIAFNVGLGAGR